MIDFVYKLQLHYNIYALIFPIWIELENNIKMKIPLDSCNFNYMQKETYLYHENQQNKLFKIKDVQNKIELILLILMVLVCFFLHIIKFTGI